MKNVVFFKKINHIELIKLFPELKLLKSVKIKDISTLEKSDKGDLSFFDSIKYSDYAKNTKASACITTKKLQDLLPDNCIKIVVKSVLFELANVTKKFYPLADIDYPDDTLKKIKKSKYPKCKFGNNVLIGKNVRIGKNSVIGDNTIIEQNTVIGKNNVIGSDVLLKNCILDDDVVIQSGCKIGLKGFGFIPLAKKNFKFPHIGKVIINKNVEIASSCTIDRGSIDDTVIGENTYLDNQVHVAHNVKIGNNCMIAGQVGFAGSCSIGNNVSIGGQAGVSGHLKIGNNVRIAGGSGVIKDIPDNQTVMGYPAIPLKKFIKRFKND